MLGSPQKAAIFAAALTRIAAPVLPALYDELLVVAAGAWLFGFAVFLLVYGPMLISSKQTT